MRGLGRYRIHRELSSGGLGTVHLATSGSVGGFRKVVAIKRLHPEFRKDGAARRLFLEEARISARISHANVVQTLDVVDADGEVFLVMEYVHGEALHRLFDAARERGEPIPIPIAVAIVLGLLRGLAAAHEMRDDDGRALELVHRDVSPQNIIVGVDGIPRLLDFGIARAAGQTRITKEGNIKGKLAYMAPEQLEGAPLSQASDLYACGVLLWELLTGTRLFAGETEAVVVARAISCTVAPPSDLREGVSKSLNRVVLRSLSRNPSLRFGSAATMAQELENAVAPASAAVVGAWVAEFAAEALRSRAAARAESERASHTGVRRRGTRWGPLALIIVLILVGIWFGVRSRRTEEVRSVASSNVRELASIFSDTRDVTSTIASSSRPLNPEATDAALSLQAPSVSVKHSRGRPPPIVSSSKAVVPSDECDPPYFVDPSGRKEFKRQCL